MTKHLTPNWFASVMGTGILATAAAALPAGSVALRLFATAAWLVACALLLVLSAAFAVHWLCRRDEALAHARHPVAGQFYGAPPMATLTVGAGAGQWGGAVVGESAATWAAAVLWAAGTAGGLLMAFLAPYRMIVSPDRGDGLALPAWLMPVVPPMVSAATGAALAPHVGAGQARLTLLVACYAMFGVSFFLGMLTMAMVYSRLVRHGLVETQSVPTVWIMLGMIGQSVAAANLLGAKARLVFDGPQEAVATGLRVFGICYGLIMGGFGAIVFALAAALTVHAARRGLAFSLTWWSFTFPVGTCATGAAALGAATGSEAVRAVAVLLYLLLLGAWAVVAKGTVAHAARLFRAGLTPPSAPAVPRSRSLRSRSRPPVAAAPRARLRDLADTSSRAPS